MPVHGERMCNKARKRVNDHMSRCLKTGGEDGHIWGGVPTLLLATIGRESGEPYTTPLIYGRDPDPRYPSPISGEPIDPWNIWSKARPQGGLKKPRARTSCSQ